MKKFIKILLVLLCIVVSTTGMFACNKKPKTAFQQATSLAAKKYSVVDVLIDSTTENVTLQAHYIYERQKTNTKITYTYQELNAFEMVDGVYTPTAEMIKEKSGVAVVKKRSIISQEGDKPQGDLVTKSIKWKFTEKNFSSSSFTDASLEGDVIDCVALCGISATNARVKVTFRSNALESIVLSCDVGAAKVVYTFTFIK